MIFNAKEVANVLDKYLFDSELTNKEIIIIRTLIWYLDHQEPKITFDEFNELFEVEKKQVGSDTFELNVVPKNKFYVKFLDGRLVADGIRVNPKVQKHVQVIAYNEFKKLLDNLKEH